MRTALAWTTFVLLVVATVVETLLAIWGAPAAGRWGATAAVTGVLAFCSLLWCGASSGTSGRAAEQRERRSDA